MLNSGASFGIDFWGLNVVSIFVLIVVFLIWKKDGNRGWLLIIFGGILNLVERIIFGYVHDYWRIPLTNIYNNFNDYLIFIGGIMVLWKKLK